MTELLRGKRFLSWQFPAILTGAVFLISVSAILLLPGLSPTTPGEGLIDLPDPAQVALFEEASGLRVTRVAVTAGGGLIDFRYQVIDADRAALTLGLDTPPTIVDEASGKGLNQPWMAHSDQHEVTAGRTYSVLIVNAGGVIRPGSSVTVSIGDHRLQHLVAR